MKKVCFFISSLNNCGGTERVSSIIANKLAEHGFEVCFLSLYSGLNPHFDLIEGVEVRELYENKVNFNIGYFRVVNLLKKYINESGIDIFIDVDTILSLYSLPALIGNRKVLHISWEHFQCDVNLSNFKRPIARFLVSKFSDKIVCLTEFDKCQWIKKYKVGNKIENIPNPSPYMNENFSKKDKKIILTAGRIEEIKGIDLLIESWFKSKVKDDGWLLYIVGDGTQKSKIINLIKDYNLNDSVFIYDKTNNIESFYKECSLFVLPSREESFGMVLVEAMSFGVPVLSFNCNGPSEIINDNVNGWIIKRFDTNGLANKLDYFSLEFKSNTYDDLCNAAFKSSKKYSSDEILNKWLDLFV